MLRELGDAINESVSGSERVNATIEKIRRHGYQLFLNLDARIGVQREEGLPEDGASSRSGPPEASFRMDLRDLRFLKSVGIDPTRKVAARRRAARRVRSAVD